MLSERDVAAAAAANGARACSVSGKTGLNCDHLLFLLADVLLNPN